MAGQWTLAVAVKDPLEETERRFGPRDPSYCAAVRHHIQISTPPRVVPRDLQLLPLRAGEELLLEAGLVL